MRIPIARFVSLVSLVATVTCFGQNLSIVTEEYPPYNFLSSDRKTVVGMSADIVRELAKRAGIKVTIAVFPWQRALSLAQNESDTGVISAIRSHEREPNYKWVGPIVVDNLAIFGLAGTKIELKSILDVKGYQIGTYNGSIANEYLRSNGINPDVVPSDALNLEKLQAGRIDLWVASFRTGPYMAKRAGINLERLYLFEKRFNFPMYIAVNKGLPDETVDRLNRILKGMADDGTLEKIIAQY